MQRPSCPPHDGKDVPPLGRLRSVPCYWFRMDSLAALAGTIKSPVGSNFHHAEPNREFLAAASDFLRLRNNSSAFRPSSCGTSARYLVSALTAATSSLLIA